MNKSHHITLAILCLFYGAFTQAQSSRPIGANLAAISPWATQIMFKDAMKQSSDWFAQHRDFSDFNVTDIGGVPVEIPLTDEGWPRQVPFVVNGDSLQPHLTLLNNQPAPWHYPSGDYLLRFEGTGTVAVHWPDVVGYWRQFSTPNVDHFVEINATNLGVDIVILASDSADPIRNIQFVLPDHSGTYTTDPFLPEFESMIAPFEALRFMKPGATEETTITDWDQRTEEDYYHYGTDRDGVVRDHMPYPLMTRLCNDNGKDMWLNVPHAATNDFIDSLATFLRDNLDDSLTLYLEYSNETWNSGYPVAHNYVNTQGLLQGLDTVPYDAGQKFHVKRSIELFERFDNIFGNASDRIYTLVSTMAYAPMSEVIIESIGDSSLNPNSYMPDAISVAPYIGSEVIIEYENQGVTCSRDEQDMLDSLEQNLTGWMDELAGTHADWADSLGIDLIAYEGGQYLASNYGASPADTCAAPALIAANRDPRMTDIYCDYFNYWHDSIGGGIMMSFNLCEAYNEWGAFGMAESVFQDPDSSVKMLSLQGCGTQGGTTSKSERMENEMRSGADWKVFPNPLRESIRLDGFSPHHTASYSLFDARGSLITQGLASGESLQHNGIGSADLPAGLYFLRVAQGGSEKSFRLVKQ